MFEKLRIKQVAAAITTGPRQWTLEGFVDASRRWRWTLAPLLFKIDGPEEALRLPALGPFLGEELRHALGVRRVDISNSHCLDVGATAVNHTGQEGAVLSVFTG